MKTTFEIHPKTGVARVGNSVSDFYLDPDQIGGLPIECDSCGNPIFESGIPRRVKTMKDRSGRIKRQAARFRIYRHFDDPGRPPEEIILGKDKEVVKIEWTVHLANKKPVWYVFSELKGDRMFGDWNSYEAQRVPLRNNNITGKDRLELMCDPGPRSVNTPGESVLISRHNVPESYTHASFPPTDIQPETIDSLGELKMNDAGQLIVLGGHGKCGGTQKLDFFAGVDGWFDDVSDGYVLATITLKSGQTMDLEPAYVITGSPNFAPEIPNIVSTDDVIFDTCTRYLDMNPKIYDRKKCKNDLNRYDPLDGFNLDYKPNYSRDIEAILKRADKYRWVANIPSMAIFSRPDFDPGDSSPANKANRKKYFSYFRIPVPPEYNQFINKIKNGPNQLLSDDGVPLMPVNVGSNAVTNTLIYKFLALTLTQYFFLHQWAEGNFTTGDAESDMPPDIIDLDRASWGNCVGLPVCPGIEVTWLMRNPAVYSAPYRIRIKHWNGNNRDLQDYYEKNGLDPKSDPGKNNGSEPGDITKRLTSPWQADYFECTIMVPNIDNPEQVTMDNANGIMAPPGFYAYWWPPQAPMRVISGTMDGPSQVLDGMTSEIIKENLNLPFIAAGQPVEYTRGVDSYKTMLSAWHYLGFIINKGSEDYPFMVESERNFAALAQTKEIISNS